MVQERNLVKAVLGGDKLAQRDFYDRHVDRVFALARRMTGDESAACDCTQTAFIRMFDKLHTFKGQSRLSTWVHAVAVSIVLQWRRDTARRRQREMPLESIEELPAQASERAGLIDESIRRAIDALSTTYQTIVVMHDIEGYTHEEIGAALGITAGTSKVRLSRARAKLRELLADHEGEFIYEQ